MNSYNGPYNKYGERDERYGPKWNRLRFFIFKRDKYVET